MKPHYPPVFPVHPTIHEVRSRFPALSSGFAYLENAGGTQALGEVIDAMAHHMRTDFVQLGAGYPQSNDATDMMADSHAFMSEFMNADRAGKVVLGPSTTALIHLIANAYGEILRPGDEIVIAESNHEANVGAWLRLERFGLKVRFWPLDAQTFRCEPAVLQALVTDRTRIVTLPHASNIFGQVEDLAAVARIAHSVGADVVADGVAYAPHRAIDVEAFGVDWYVFSTYKVYGPHLAALFGTHQAFAKLTGPNHVFIPKESVPAKWELGGVSHEACAGLLGLRPYLGFLAGGGYDGRSSVESAFAKMNELEHPAEALLRGWLSAREDVRLLGPATAGSNTVGTVSFVHKTVPSDTISASVNGCNIGIRHGSMYAVRLCEALGIGADTGVVRVSLVHYNTEDEVQRVITALEDAFEL